MMDQAELLQIAEELEAVVQKQEEEAAVSEAHLGALRGKAQWWLILFMKKLFLFRSPSDNPFKI